MIKAKKKYGQNFLKDGTAVSKIIEAIPFNNNHLVEIGPGLGDLTRYLVKRKDVLAYEVDSELYNYLGSEFSQEIDSGKLQIHLGDVLSYWDQNPSLYSSAYDLIANLPYYIATNIILRALNDNNCKNIIVMVQKEVALKFTAKSKDSDFCALSVIADKVSEFAEILFVLPPSAFNPPPKVDSAVIYIKKKDGISLDESFNKFLKVAFSQPRKTLLKNLSQSHTKENLLQIFSDLKLSDTIRPHELDTSLFSLIYERIYKDERIRTTNTNQ